MKPTLTQMLVIVPMVMIATGCDAPQDRRMIEMAERQLARQAEQTKDITELQREVAKGSRELIEADAKSRQDMVTLHREVQQERADFGKQRDALEQDRRQIASQRQWDSLTASAITTGGLLLGCLLPLVLCLYLIQKPESPAEEHAVLEYLLTDLTAREPLLLPPANAAPAIEHRRPENSPSASGDSATSSE